MKRSCKYIAVAMMLLSAVWAFTSCEAEDSIKQESADNVKIMIPVDPVKVKSGDYVFEPSNIIYREFNTLVCDCCDDFFVDLKLDKAVKYCKETTDTPMDFRTYTDDYYKNMTEYEIFGKKIKLDYKESIAYADGSITHCYGNLSFDKNGKLIYLDLTADGNSDGAVKISEEEAKNSATRFITEHTYATDLASWIIEKDEKASKNNYVFVASETVSGVKTSQSISVTVDAYSGAILYLTVKDTNVFDSDLSIAFDKVIFEQYLLDIVKPKLDDKVEYYDEPIYIKEWEAIFGEYDKIFNDNVSSQEGDNQTGDADTYTAIYTLNSEWSSFEYTLCAFADGTPYISIDANIAYTVTERNPEGDILLSEPWLNDSYKLCIFPDGSEVVKAQKQN